MGISTIELLIGRERAAEIATMKEFGLPEFRELTGIGAGRYSIYQIDANGVSPPFQDDSPDLTAAQQDELYKAKQILSLAFPCTPLEFIGWHDRTRGAKAIDASGKEAQAPSDFPLAPGFVEALKRINQIKQRESRPSIPSPQIMAAFKVKLDPSENHKWWDTRMRDSGRYMLKNSRASPGRAKIPSYWYPDLVAAWLIESGHLSRDTVIGAVEQHFPEIETTYL